MTFSFDWDFDIHIDRIRQVEGSISRAGDRFLSEIAEEMVSDIKLSYGTSPSPPGSPPGVDTGNLRAGTQWWNEAPWLKIVGPQAEYGPYLEFGTRAGLEARPFIGPVFENWRGKIANEARKYNWV